MNATPENFRASNGITILPGGYPAGEHYRASLEDIQLAQREYRDSGGDTSFEAQQRNAFHVEPEEPREPKGRPVFGFRLALEVLANMKPADWLVRDILERDSVALIFGDPGTYKSFVALSFSVCCAAGIPWHGIKTQQGPVLYIAGEGLNGLARRLRALSIELDVDLGGLPLGISNGPTALTNEVSVAELEAAVAVFAEQYGNPVLIVVDTLARNFGPGNENDTHDMNAAVDACTRLRLRTGATVLLVHHTGHSDKERARGSGSMRGALDAEYRLQRNVDGTMLFQSTKMKDDAEPAPIGFRLHSVPLGFDDDEGRPVTSAVLRLDETATTPRRKIGGKNQTLALSVLRKLRAEHQQRLLTPGLDPSTAQVSLDDWRAGCLADGMNRHRFHEARTALESGQVVQVACGLVQEVIDA